MKEEIAVLVRKLLETQDLSEQNTFIRKILDANPDWREVSGYLCAIEFPETKKDTVLIRKHLCSDGVERSWLLYVPPSYSPQKPSPLFVYLHGGVTIPEPLSDSEALAYLEGDEFADLAKREGWLLLFPLGQTGAAWWDRVGMSNINELVRTVKQGYNVDDDRVWMAGFSDGASGAFVYGMLNPTDYAAFLSLSGYIGDGNLYGNLYTYASNLANTPTYVVTSFEDEGFPSEKIRPTVKMAQDAGGDIYYREQEGRHDFSYVADEAERFARFLYRHPRDPFAPRITWETAYAEFGRCRWFAIDAVNSSAEPASWHKDYNSTLRDDKVTVGFNIILEYEGQGIKVGNVLEGMTADSIGLREGDIIVGAEGVDIRNIEDWNSCKNTKKRGDSITLTVLRGDRELMLKGKLPDATESSVFRHDVPSARANVSFFANRIDVESSRVGTFSIFVHPDMIRLERPLVVTADGKEEFNGKVEPDIEFMLRNFLENRDRKLIYVARVQIDLQ